MQLRKLDTSEHKLTRKLWENVFLKDSRLFLDYYYFIKARENQIYVIEEEEQIRSMLQLNPYLLQIEKEQHCCHYIVAVATQETYRKRGYMGNLLRKAMEDMYAKKEPFTFLMPEAEAIYTPYDFRFIYDQEQLEIAKQKVLMEAAQCEEVCELDATMVDATRMTDFFNAHVAVHMQVYARRDEMYYQTMLMEQQSEQGGIRLLLKDNELLGMFAYARGNELLEVREAVIRPEAKGEFLRCIHHMNANSNAPVKIHGHNLAVQGHRTPMIMARLLHIETFLGTLQIKTGEEIHCSFAVLDPILSKNNRVWSLNGTETHGIEVKETEDSEGVLTVGALTSFLFGYKTLEQIQTESDVYISERLVSELKKIRTLNRVFLNEIV